MASYQAKRQAFTIDDLGYRQQVELFDQVADHHGSAPPVVDSGDIRDNPAAMLKALCAAIGLDFDEAMLGWSPGLRSTDGVWAAHWYDRLAASTGFAPPEGKALALSPEGQLIADTARPLYHRMARYRLRPDRG